MYHSHPFRSPADRQTSVGSLLVSPTASLKRTLAKQQLAYRPTLNRLMSHPLHIGQDKIQPGEVQFYYYYTKHCIDYTRL